MRMCVVLAYAQFANGLLPAVVSPLIKGTAALAGTSPQTIAATVAAPLERQLGRIASVTDVRSYSIYGRTSITLEFELGRDIDRAANDVQAAINAASAELPKNLSEPPSLVKNDGSIVPLLQLALTSETLPTSRTMPQGIARS